MAFFRDRVFQFEICMATNTTMETYPRRGGCSFGAVNVSPKSISNAVFHSYRAGDVHECAHICANNPFCYTFTWDSDMETPMLRNCGLSYQRPDDCTEESSCCLQELVAEGMISVGCFQCESFKNWQNTYEKLNLPQELEP